MVIGVFHLISFADRLEGMKIVKKILPSGLTVVVVPMKESVSVTVDVSVRTGSFYENKETNGISHFLEHMCFKGTEKRPYVGQIMRELEEIGAQANASTGNEVTSYYITALPHHFDTVLDVVSDVYLNSTFPIEEIEKEKGVVCDEIDMYEDDPKSVASRLLASKMYGDNPWGWDIAGTKGNVRALNQKKIIEYRNKYYVASNTVVTVAGPIDILSVRRKISQKFVTISKNKAPRLSKKKITLQGPITFNKDRPTEQVHVRIGYEGVSRKSKDKYAYALLSHILGGGMSSRLFNRLREKMGVSYYVGSYHSAMIQAGKFGIYAGVSGTRVQEALHAIEEECSLLTKELVPVHEFKKVTEMLSAGLIMNLETSSAVAEYASTAPLFGEETLSPVQLMARIKKVTPQDIKRVAKKVFSQKPFIITVGKIL